jgi:hypothetical protein
LLLPVQQKTESMSAYLSEKHYGKDQAILQGSRRKHTRGLSC